jgi:hypothetical protein
VIRTQIELSGAQSAPLTVGPSWFDIGVETSVSICSLRTSSLTCCCSVTVSVPVRTR